MEKVIDKIINNQSKLGKIYDNNGMHDSTWNLLMHLRKIFIIINKSLFFKISVQGNENDKCGLFYIMNGEV